MNFPSSPSSPLVYVADDNADIGEVIGFTLQLAGVQMRFFQDPRELLEAFTKEPKKPALLITDYQMPQMNGLELIQRCKALCPELKTISVSGTLGLEDIHGYPVLPDRHLAKPFQPRELLALVRELLSGEKTV